MRAIMLVAVLSLTACNSVFDDEEDCTPYHYIKFVYDMNMLYADAFATQVSSVDLYVFDAETGEYITHYADKGEALASGSYKMPINLAPGKYKFIAWCGIADHDDFSVPGTNEINKEEDLICTMYRTRDVNGAYSNRNLHALFHGSTVEVLTDEEGEHVYTVRLIRDTNNIILSLNHSAGELDKDRFEITVTDENGLLAHDNSLMKDEPIEYRPWDLRSGSLDIVNSTKSRAENEEENSEDEDENKVGYLKAEISTSRFMADREMRINIRDKEEDKIIFSIPMIKYALELRSELYASMGEQEYLDREYNYDLMVFLTDNNKGGWMVASIYINGWHKITAQGEVEL